MRKIHDYDFAILFFAGLWLILTALARDFALFLTVALFIFGILILIYGVLD